MTETKTTEQAQPARALVSASNIWRRFTCPGSGAAEAGLPDVSSPYAAEGTLLHYFDANPNASREDLTDAQIFALEKNARLREEALAKFFAQHNIPPSAKRREFVEREFWLCDEEGTPVEPGVPGHPDRVIYFPDYQAAFIQDSKFGRLPVPSADINLQLRTYTVMFAEHFDLSLVGVCITQPWMKSPDDLHMAYYDREAIAASKKELLAIVRGVYKPNATRKASREACAYCRAKGVNCKESLTIAADLAILKIQQMSVDELEAIGESISIAAGVIDAWKKRMKELAAQGVTKLYELGTAANDRVFTDAMKAFGVLQSEGLLGPDKEAALAQFLSMSSPSVAQLEKHCYRHWKAANKKSTEKEAKERFKLLMGALVELKPKEAPLRRKSDTKPEEATNES